MKRLLLAIVLFLPASARADNRAVLAIQGKDCTTPSACAIARGSCVAVGRSERGNLLVLTAAHVVRQTSDVKVYVGGEWRDANVLRVTKRDANWDLALVEVTYQETWPCVQLVRDILGTERSEVTVAGYEGGVRWVHRRGLLGRHTDKYWLWWNDAPPAEGQSGGAVIVGGSLAGIISARTVDGSREGVGQNAGAIRVFLESCHRSGITIVYPSPQSPRPPVATIPNPAPGPQPNDTIPNPAPGPNQSKELAELRAEVAALQKELAAVRDRPITVKLRDAQTKQVETRTFAPGEPIRLELPTRQPLPAR